MVLAEQLSRWQKEKERKGESEDVVDGGLVSKVRQPLQDEEQVRKGLVVNAC